MLNAMKLVFISENYAKILAMHQIHRSNENTANEYSSHNISIKIQIQVYQKHVIKKANVHKRQYYDTYSYNGHTYCFLHVYFVYTLRIHLSPHRIDISKLS